MHLLHVKPKGEPQAHLREDLTKKQKLLTTSYTVSLQDVTVGGTALGSVETAITDLRTRATTDEADIATLTTAVARVGSGGTYTNCSPLAASLSAASLCNSAYC
jgi:hypothetical protein